MWRVGPLFEDLITLPTYACTHQTAMRLKEVSSRASYDSKTQVPGALLAGGIAVRGRALRRVVLEESPRRKHEYNKWGEGGWTLRIYGAQTWQELGTPTISDWTWDRAAFVEAGIAAPSFLRGESC